MTPALHRSARRWTLRDWRDADGTLVRACYDAERHHWARELAWETSWTWSTVEQARVTWGLPGLLAFDESGRLQGWSFYTVTGTTLNIGGLVASCAGAGDALLDAMLDAAAQRTIDLASCFILDRAPGLPQALAARGFEVESFLYLARPLSPFRSLEQNAGERRDGETLADVHPIAASADVDLAELASLLQASYTPQAGRHFAPHGTREEWARYVTGLVRYRGCGVFDPDATCYARDDAGLQGMALITSLGSSTAHLAQMAVRPDARGRRLAASLLRDASARAAAAGRTVLTLLVSERNAPARRLYESSGFTKCGRFVAGISVRESAREDTAVVA
jgi:ribosomal protein S18 acetylase RimI-like enzyme